jgi:hypothetical protein
MKKQIMTTITALAVLITLAAGSAQAQSSYHMKVEIPFDFSIGSKTFSAGRYGVRRDIKGARIVLELRNDDNAAVAYFATHTTVARDIQQEPKLVFNKYGARFFLSQIWMAGRSSGDELSRTRDERTLALEAAKSRQTDTVSVVGRKQ